MATYDIPGPGRMTGTAENDIFIVDNINDEVVEQVNQGFDIVYSSVSWTLTAEAHVEVLSVNDYAATAAINLTGNGFGQQIFGNAGANVLNGGGGADSLIGGLGNDTYIVDGDDSIVEAAGEGFDTVNVNATYTLYAGAEIEVLSVGDYWSTGAINLTGNAFGQRIVGNAGGNVLNGGGGVDTLVGGLGNDIYIVDGDDAVAEAAGEGFDQVYASASHVLRAGAEIEVLSVNDYAATAAINLTGNAFGQQIFGNAGANVLNGGGGVDTLVGGAGDDVYVMETDDIAVEGAGGGYDIILARGSEYYLPETSSIEEIRVQDAASTVNFILRGNSGYQWIVGNEGNNIIVGAGGNDILQGEGGNDWYWIYSGDRVFEFAGEGHDKVHFYNDSYVLPENIEDLQYYEWWGMSTLDFVGNGLSNVITGNMGAGTFRGGNGGADLLSGLGGDDVYYVDGDDRVEEQHEHVRATDGKWFAGGYDRVFASSDYTLEYGASIEELSGATGVVRLTGNEFGQTINGNDGYNVLSGGGGNDKLYGNKGDDRLDGGTGADIMDGGEGNDTYYVDSLSDNIVEHAGRGSQDQVYVGVSGYRLHANVENMVISETAGAGGIYYGNDQDNLIILNSKGGTVVPGLGQDTIRFGSGKDILKLDKIGDTLEFYNFQQDQIHIPVYGGAAPLRDVDLASRFRTVGVDFYEGDTNVLVWWPEENALLYYPPEPIGGYEAFVFFRLGMGSSRFDISSLRKMYDPPQLAGADGSYGKLDGEAGVLPPKLARADGSHGKVADEAGRLTPDHGGDGAFAQTSTKAFEADGADGFSGGMDWGDLRGQIDLQAYVLMA
jgi:Ca2+-binding RTX toxin-like protein